MQTTQNDYKKTSRLFAALADTTRLEILNVLTNDSNVCVSALADKLGLSVSAVSQQCKLLELSGLLRRTRQGQRICYQLKLEDPIIRKVLKIIKE